MARFKGDDTLTRPRAILADGKFERLMATTLVSKDRRNLSGELRFWLYMTASQTGCRAQELNSLKPSRVNFDSEPTVTVACAISKRRKTDTILLSRDFAQMLKPWLDDQEPDRRPWGCSSSWWYTAGDMLRRELKAAGIEHERGGAMIDFHGFRAFRITSWRF